MLFSSYRLLAVLICFVPTQLLLSQNFEEFNPRTTEIAGLTWTTDNLNIYYQGSNCFKGYTANGRHWTAESMCKNYGRLYTIEAALAIDRMIEGWHIPTDEEWGRLEQALGMSAEEVQQTRWRGAGTANKIKQGSYDTDLRIQVGGGSIDKYGHSSGYPEFTYYWSSTQHDSGQYWCRGFSLKNSTIYRNYTSNSSNSRYYVRLVKDYEPPASTPSVSTTNQSESAPVSPVLLQRLKDEVIASDEEVQNAFFPDDSPRTRYPQVYISTVEVLINRLQCATESETDDYTKLHYYRFRNTVNQRIIQVLGDRQWAKEIERNLEGMTAEQGNPGIVLESLKLTPPAKLEIPYQCNN